MTGKSDGVLESAPRGRILERSRDSEKATGPPSLLKGSGPTSRERAKTLWAVADTDLTAVGYPVRLIRRASQRKGPEAESAGAESLREILHRGNRYRGFNAMARQAFHRPS